MRAAAERSVGVAEAIALMRATLDRAGLTCEVRSGGVAGFPVHRCCLRDQAGQAVAYALGKGPGRQSEASMLYEAWQHLQHERGQRGLIAHPDRVRVHPVAEVVVQPALAREAVMHRLATDFPDAQVACLRMTSLTGSGGQMWYPAFARSPSLRWYPVPGDDMRYVSYLRYSYDNGTACAVTEPDAVLHALLEVIERDAVSLAMLDWYAADPPRARVVPLQLLPADLRALAESAAGYLGVPPLLLDVTSDLGVPAFAALPAEPLDQVGCSVPARR